LCFSAHFSIGERRTKAPATLANGPPNSIVHALMQQQDSGVARVACSPTLSWASAIPSWADIAVVALSISKMVAWKINYLLKAIFKVFSHSLHFEFFKK